MSDAGMRTPKQNKKQSDNSIWKGKSKDIGERNM